MDHQPRRLAAFVIRRSLGAPSSRRGDSARLPKSSSGAQTKERIDGLTSPAHRSPLSLPLHLMLHGDEVLVEARAVRALDEHPLAEAEECSEALFHGTPVG